MSTGTTESQGYGRIQWRKGGGIKENMEYGGGEVNEISFELFLPRGDGEVFKADAGPARAG